MEIEEMLKDKILYIEVDSELLKTLKKLCKHYGTEDKIKIGDIVAMDEDGCSLSSKDEMTKIPKEKIISISIGPKSILTMR